MRKSILLILPALFGCSILFTSCSEEQNGEGLENKGKAEVVLAVDMAPTASMGYIVPVLGTQ